VEASAVRAPAGQGRRPIGVPLLRLRTDDQLLALFRAGSDEAFRVIYDRYRQRLFAYVRQMLWSGPRQDAEDLLQDVFVRAYGALRADSRDVNVRAWLYRVAHNRCIDHLRRPVLPPADVFELSRKPLCDPIEGAQRREDLARLVEDVGRLPEQQRSALLMREMDGMSYADLAVTLDVTVPAVKSLLVRARVGLVEAAEARDADCHDIRADLAASCDRGVKASAHARKHLRNCRGCREYRAALRGVRRSFAALNAGPLALAAAKLLGGGSAATGGSATATSGAAAAGGAATAGGTAVGVVTAGGSVVSVGGIGACKVAAVVCTAALTAGGAVEVRERSREPDPPAPVARVAAAPVAAADRVVAPVVERRVSKPRPAAVPVVDEKPAKAEPEAAAEPADEELEPLPEAGETGGVEAPAGDSVPGEDEEPAVTEDEAATSDDDPQEPVGSAGPPAEPAAAPASQAVPPPGH
jgi:RNA polymerase sigma factor (sigma-70 family)